MADSGQALLSFEICSKFSFLIGWWDKYRWRIRALLLDFLKFRFLSAPVGHRCNSTCTRIVEDALCPCSLCCPYFDEPKLPPAAAFFYYMHISPFLLLDLDCLQCLSWQKGHFKFVFLNCQVILLGCCWFPSSCSSSQFIENALVCTALRHEPFDIGKIATSDRTLSHICVKIHTWLTCIRFSKWGAVCVAFISSFSCERSHTTAVADVNMEWLWQHFHLTTCVKYTKALWFLLGKSWMNKSSSGCST